MKTAPLLLFAAAVPVALALLLLRLVVVLWLAAERLPAGVGY